MNFEQTINRRSSNSIKWNPELIQKWCGVGGEDLLSFWVADMDFRCPEPIIESVRQVAEQGLYGYSDITASYYQSIIGWYHRRMGCLLQQDWICYCNGIVPGLNYILQAFCSGNDKLIIQPPVYYPFVQAAENNHVGLLCNELIYRDGQYYIDFEDLERKASDPDAKVLFLCSPHNPVGRVWNANELLQIAEICKRHKVLLVSDEIHGDIVYSPTVFHSMLEFEMCYDQLIVCSSPSKTFNIAGFQMSNIIIPSQAIRTHFNRILQRNSILMPNIMGIRAVEAAYNHCEDWLEQLLIVLKENMEVMEQQLKKTMPTVQMVKPEGTYMAWLDMSRLPYSYLQRAERIAKHAKVILDHGYIFGSCGEGFERINFACTQKNLVEGLDRIARAL